MLLAIDIGNSQTVIGVYDKRRLRFMWRVTTNSSDTADELRVKVASLLATSGIDAAEVSGSIVASVVPILTSSWKHVLLTLTGDEPLVCSAKTAGNLFVANYRNTTEIGADRVADAVAARRLYGAPVVVVDFGTATNLEVIDAKGYFIGGVIAPGLETSAAALFVRATKLPTVDLINPGSVIGKNTVHAIQSGIVYGEADRVDGFIRRIFKELGYSAPVVATGGLAKTIAPLCEMVTSINSELTLEGLRLIYEAAQ